MPRSGSSRTIASQRASTRVLSAGLDARGMSCVWGSSDGSVVVGSGAGLADGAALAAVDAAAEGEGGGVSRGGGKKSGPADDRGATGAGGAVRAPASHACELKPAAGRGPRLD